MPLIKSAVAAISLILAGTFSAVAAPAYDSSRVESMRAFEWAPKSVMSAEARRARAQALTSSRRQEPPFSRMSLEKYFQ